MLTAILRGKARRLTRPIAAGDSWSDVFNISEDFLTASVFERLAYLDAPTFWAVLRDATRSELPACGADIELETFELWPRWGVGEGTVEPDAYIRFKTGSRLFSLIVEAKLDGVQSAAQWVRELRGQVKGVADGRDETVVLLAIGGLRKDPATFVAAETARARGIMTSEGLQADIEVVWLEWQDLTDAVGAMRARSETFAVQRIFDDILAALALHRYWRFAALTDLLGSSDLRGFLHSSADYFKRWNELEPGPVPTPTANATDWRKWVGRTQYFRPIGGALGVAKRVR